MTPAPAHVPPAPVAFVLWHRPPGARQGAKVATAPTRVELLHVMKGKGDFMLLPVSDVRLVGVVAIPTDR